MRQRVEKNANAMQHVQEVKQSVQSFVVVIIHTKLLDPKV